MISYEAKTSTINRAALIEELRGGRQCDERGEEIIMSRQACCEAAALLEAPQAINAEPLSRMDILNIHALRCWPRTMFADKSYGIALDTVTVIDFTRAIEAAIAKATGAKP